MTVLGPGRRQFNIPSPALLAAKRTGPVLPAAVPPPILGFNHHPAALYWVETNAAIAFYHANRLDLLAEHLGDRMRVVSDVHAEWATKADSFKPKPSQYSSAEEREAYRQWQKVVRACKGLCGCAVDVLGEPVDLDVGEIEHVDRLRDHLASLPEAEPAPAADDHWTHRGECATVRAAQLLEARRIAGGDPKPVQVIVTNDRKAGVLARHYGFAERTTAQVLREMVLAGTGGLDAETAWDLHQQMHQVAKIPAAHRPHGSDFFYAPED